ncbi:hypothetical protein DFP72DRAFT_1008721 [Ephemerocybe angulata]|uniref:Protein kinase domain-containing protein n=1 Tax=Ephemerocybe angulata TaxID=980116 RepID=A0A8H6HZR3_9AGAR|nr:hypothetical protein DFP72DRAFT_1008721 [Tulosesus angulatus]
MLQISLQHDRRKHRRVVFKEACKSLAEEMKADTALNAIADIAQALNLLQKVGYIHRDVSAGNCLIYGSGGKLSDLESCKSYLAKSKVDSFSGTTEFMAAEVLTRDLLFNNSEPKVPENIYHPHPIHDLEALNWMTWWFFLSKTLPTASPSKAAVDHWRSEIWSPLFAQPSGSFRGTILSTRSFIKRYTRLFMRCGWDEKLTRALSPVLNFVYTIGKEHIAIQQQPQVTDEERNIRWPVEVFREEPYKKYSKFLKKAAASLGNLELVSIWDHVDA